MFFHVIYNLFSLGMLRDQVHLVVVIYFWVEVLTYFVEIHNIFVFVTCLINVTFGNYSMKV